MSISTDIYENPYVTELDHLGDLGLEETGNLVFQDFKTKISTVFEELRAYIEANTSSLKIKIDAGIGARVVTDLSGKDVRIKSQMAIGEEIGIKIDRSQSSVSRTVSLRATLESTTDHNTILMRLEEEGSVEEDLELDPGSFEEKFATIKSLSGKIQKISREMVDFDASEELEEMRKLSDLSSSAWKLFDKIDTNEMKGSVKLELPIHWDLDIQLGDVHIENKGALTPSTNIEIAN